MSVTLAPIWVKLPCRAGPCKAVYTVNARTAPMWNGKPYCRKCWDRANKLNATLGWPVYDCPEGTWPDPTSGDPTRNGADAVPLRKGAKLL
jgi:hypothetical protein